MSNPFIEIIFWLSAGGILYTYAIYPLFLLLRGDPRVNVRELPEADLPGVSIVIAAYNEETVIQKRIENCLFLDYPREKVEVIIASDGSDDRTALIVKEFEGLGVRLFDFRERRGKVNVLNEVVPQARHEIVVFSDANTAFEKGALRNLVKYFADASVGCVCGLLRFVSAEGSKTGDLEGIYWKFETFLKKKEGARGALLGANGGIFAIRKSLFWPCPSDTIVEDFVLPMKILEKGHQVMYAPEAVALEETTKHFVQEKQRRIRIGAGDYQALVMLKSMLNPARGFPALAFWSHKVVRWMVPFLMVGAFVSNFALRHQAPVYWGIYLFQCLFYVAAVAGQVLSWTGKTVKGLSICYYFVSMNLALFLGFFMFLSGRQKVTWKRTER